MTNEIDQSFEGTCPTCGQTYHETEVKYETIEQAIKQLVRSRRERFIKGFAGEAQEIDRVIAALETAQGKAQRR